MVDVIAAPIDHALAVTHGQIVVRHAQTFDQRRAGNGSGTRSVDHDLDVLDLAVGQQAGVDDPGGGDDRGAVLVIVEHRYIHPVAQSLLDDEAIGCGNIFQIDATEAGLHDLNGIDDGFRVLGIELDIDRIDIGEAFEQDRFAFHDRLRGKRPQIAETKDRGAVGDDSDEIALRGIIIGFRRIVGDCTDRNGDARRIGKTQVTLSRHRLGGNNLDFSGATVGVKKQSFPFGKF